MRRHFAAVSFILGLAGAFAGSASATVVADNGSNIRDNQVGYYEWKDRYPGGEQALPYGYNDAAAVLTHARTMPAVTQAIEQLVARGYVRRPDTDVAGTQRGFSFACLGFEKPGSPVSDRQPLLVVATKAFEVPNVGFRPASQVYAGLFADSAGCVRVVSTPSDSAFGVVGQPIGASTSLTRTLDAYFGIPASPLAFRDEWLEFRYTAYEHHAGTWQYRNTTSPAMQALMSEAYQVTAWNATMGAIAGVTGFAAGPQIGTATTLLGAYTSGLAAWGTFWIEHPDTIRVR